MIFRTVRVLKCLINKLARFARRPLILRYRRRTNHADDYKLARANTTDRGHSLTPNHREVPGRPVAFQWG